LREEKERAAWDSRENIASLPQFIFASGAAVCKSCGRALLVRRTRRRKIISIRYGAFVAVEKIGYCPVHPALRPVRSLELSRIVCPGANLAYDVIAHVGFARFLYCRQNEEITIELARQYGIELPAGSISYIAQKFMAYFQIVHEQSIGLLRMDMQQRGGYILHVDGTCEEGSGVLLVCLDSLSGQVLESRKISSENHEQVKAVLKLVRQNWGVPLAVVHDLRRALISAVSEVFKGVPQFICHYHLAADVGKDILSPHADRLRRLFRRTQVRPKLRLLARSLKAFAISEDNSDPIVISILGLRSQKKLREHCTPEVVKGAVHALASWILAASQDGEGYGFPFDMPYLNLYQRIVNVHKALCETINMWPNRTRGALGTLNRLREILDTVMLGDNASAFREILAETKKDLKIFQRFRSVLRICPKGGKNRRRDEGASRLLSARRHKKALGKLRASLQRQSRSDGPSQRACNIVVQHLDKYWPLLFGHVFRKGSRKIIVPRTNNVQEGLLGIVKRQCRRLHGRRRLYRDIEAMSPATPLVLNLTNFTYCETVYGGREPEKIALRFSAVDPKTPVQLLKTWRYEKASLKMPRRLASLRSLPSQLARFLSVAIQELQE